MFFQDVIIDSESSDISRVFNIDEAARLRATLVLSHINASHALMLLHGILARRDPSAHAGVLKSAHAIVDVLRATGTVTPRDHYVQISVSIQNHSHESQA